MEAIRKITFAGLFLSIVAVGIKDADFWFFFHPETLKSNIGIITSFLLLVFFLFRLIRSNQNELSLNKELGVYSIFLIYSVIGLLWSSNKIAAVNEIIQFFSYGVFLFLLINLYRGVKISYLLNLILSVMFLSLILGAAQIYKLPYVEFIEQFRPPSSFYGNRNFFGHILIMSLPILLYKILLEKNLWKVLLFLFFYGLCFLVFLGINALQLNLTLIIIFSGVLIYIIFDYLKDSQNSVLLHTPFKLLKFSVILFFGISYLIVSSNLLNLNLLPPKKADMLHVVDIPREKLKIYSESPQFKKFRDETDFTERYDEIAPTFDNIHGGRVSMWVNTIELIKDNFILGVGPAQWSEKYQRYANSAVDGSQLWNGKRRATHPHNQPLYVFSNYGLIGGVLFYLFLLLITFRTVKAFLSPSAISYKYKFFVFLGFVSYLSVSFVSKTLHVYSSTLLFFIIIAILLSDDSDLDLKKISKNTIKFVFLLITPLAIFISYHSINALYSDYLYRLIINKKSLDLPEIINESLNVNPNNLEALNHYGIALMNKKRNKESLEVFSRIRKMKPYDTINLINLSNSYGNLGKVEDQIKVLEDILAIDPNEPRALVPLTVINFRAGNIDTANTYYTKTKKSYREFIFKNPAWLGGLNIELIKFAIDVGDDNFLNELYIDLLALFPTANNIASYAAVLLNRFNDKEKAKFFIDHAINIDPGIEAQLPEELKPKK